MGDGIGTDLLGIACNGDGLEDTLRRNRNRIAVVAHYVAVNHILQRLLVVLLRNVERYILLGTETISIALIGYQLLCRETACIGARCVYLIAFLGQFHYCV